VFFLRIRARYKYTFSYLGLLNTYLLTDEVKNFLDIGEQTVTNSISGHEH